MIPPHVQQWIDFLETIDVRGPIAITFEILQDKLGLWVLRSTMQVPTRDLSVDCDACGRPIINHEVSIQNALPGPDDTTPRSEVIRQRVLGHYQHEALESILIDGVRPYDPHHARWYSNIVADWRYNR